MQEPTRRRQAELTPRGPEVFAIHEEENEEFSPGSFRMVTMDNDEL